MGGKRRLLGLTPSFLWGVYFDRDIFRLLLLGIQGNFSMVSTYMRLYILWCTFCLFCRITNQTHYTRKRIKATNQRFYIDVGCYFLFLNFNDRKHIRLCNKKILKREGAGFFLRSIFMVIFLEFFSVLYFFVYDMYEKPFLQEQF